MINSDHPEMLSGRGDVVRYEAGELSWGQIKFGNRSNEDFVMLFHVK